jgi:hypothetical protein
MTQNDVYKRAQCIVFRQDVGLSHIRTCDKRGILQQIDSFVDRRQQSLAAQQVSGLAGVFVTFRVTTFVSDQVLEDTA